MESQEQIATLGYVDTLEEQAMLEDLLETVKPPYPQGSEAYHYLLKTPFRYPPLRWGSRFGRIHEPSLFYGGCSIATTLAESAYYRLLFWFSMGAAPPKDKIRTEHSLFAVNYATNKGVRLQATSFEQYQAELAHPQSYAPAQQLGTAMRAAGVEAFEYPSARDPGKGNCVGLFSHTAFAEKTPHGLTRWLCEVGASEVSFKQLGSSTVTRFAVEVFLLDGVLPLPA